MATTKRPRSTPEKRRRQQLQSGGHCTERLGSYMPPRTLLARHAYFRCVPRVDKSNRCVWCARELTPTDIAMPIHPDEIEELRDAVALGAELEHDAAAILFAEIDRLTRERDRILALLPDDLDDIPY